MNNTHFVKCDRCAEPMLFQHKVREVVQSYRCFACKRRALVYLNNQGGVLYIDYADKTANTMLAYSVAGLIGDKIFKRKSKIEK